MQISFQNSFELRSYISWFSSALGNWIYCRNPSTKALIHGGGCRMWEWGGRRVGQVQNELWKWIKYTSLVTLINHVHDQRAKWKLCVWYWTVHIQMKCMSIPRELDSGYSPHHHSTSSPRESTKPKLSFSDLVGSSSVGAGCLLFKSSFSIAY